MLTRPSKNIRHDLGNVPLGKMELGTSFSNHCDNFLVAFALVLFCFNHWGNRIGACDLVSALIEFSFTTSMLKLYRLTTNASRQRVLTII